MIRIFVGCRVDLADMAISLERWGLSASCVTAKTFWPQLTRFQLHFDSRRMMHRAMLLVGLFFVPASVSRAMDPSYFGFYQPYGLRTETFSPTPPYFSIHPPVYYGQRYSRPYGISPFPAMPQVGVPADFKAIRRSESVVNPQMNPFCTDCGNETVPTVGGSIAGGEVQTNPFVSPLVRLASDPSI